MFSLTLTDIISLGVGLLTNVAFVSYITGKVRAEVETELLNIKSNMVNDQKIHEVWAAKFDRMDERVKNMETNTATMSVKIDNIKEGVDDLKKAIADKSNRFN